MNIIEQLECGYDEYRRAYDRAPNAILMGYNEKAELVRCLLNQRMVPYDIPPRDGSVMNVMGCEVLETNRGGMQFAVVSDRMLAVYDPPEITCWGGLAKEREVAE